jgi:hypothetical protein
MLQTCSNLQTNLLYVLACITHLFTPIYPPRLMILHIFATLLPLFFQTCGILSLVLSYKPLPLSLTLLTLTSPSFSPTSTDDCTVARLIMISMGVNSSKAPSDLGLGACCGWNYDNGCHGGIQCINNRITSIGLCQVLKGTIPDAIGSLAKLQVLSLPQNQLNGSLPFAIRALTNLAYLDLSNNQLTGSIPEWIGCLPLNETLGLGNNNLVGSVPAIISKLPLTITCSINPQLSGEHLPVQSGWNCTSMCTTKGAVTCPGKEKTSNPQSSTLQLLPHFPPHHPLVLVLILKTHNILKP